ncbi:ABC transporter ATP-binding protein [Corynebacterium incognita]|uniref:ABC transporter ATP-binding protein n=1 Tax=Corynebacterium incognita TaxID=2754725 RepID=A0A7G7CM60_9CORY|nr:ABC transporter ATP-binding protein [Corynebacterium incognita]QNE88676.1 ABC transporter ATP-binding protein [Corynebacterium incognita]
MTYPIVLDDVTKDFGGAPVLSGISLTINPGETVAVMGPSGSGKSTLLHCMSGVLTPTHGTVSFGTEHLSHLPDKKRSHLRLHNFGFVFQDGQLLPELTNLENIALPAMLNGVSRSKANKRAQHLLDQLGLGELATRRPAQVSGGQAQRVAIARALAIEPAIIFADEPTGALDQSTGHEVMQLLTSLVSQSGSTLIMVTHDVQVANWMNRRVEIRDGIIHDDRQLGGAR